MKARGRDKPLAVSSLEHEHGPNEWHRDGSWRVDPFLFLESGLGYIPKAKVNATKLEVVSFSLSPAIRSHAGAALHLSRRTRRTQDSCTCSPKTSRRSPTAPSSTRLSSCRLKCPQAEGHSEKNKRRIEYLGFSRLSLTMHRDSYRTVFHKIHLRIADILHEPAAEATGHENRSENRSNNKWVLPAASCFP